MATNFTTTTGRLRSQEQPLRAQRYRKRFVPDAWFVPRSLASVADQTVLVSPRRLTLKNVTARLMKSAATGSQGRR